MTPSISPLSHRYAHAFLDVVEDKKVEKEIKSDMDSLKAMLEEGDIFSDFISDVTVSREDQIAVIEDIAPKAKLHILTANFLKLLASNARLHHLTEMIEAYAFVDNIRKGNTDVIVSTPFPLKEAQEKKIKAELDKALKTNTNIISEIDKTLLGGAIIHVGSLMIDDSIKGKLERLTRAITIQQAS